MGGFVVFLGESKQEVGLADGAVTQNDILEDVVGLLLQLGQLVAHYYYGMSEARREYI